MKVQENNLKCLTSKNAIINFFEKLGYAKNDIIGICFGIGEKNDKGEMRPIVFTSIEDLPKQKYYKDLVDLDKTRVFKKGIFLLISTYLKLIANAFSFSKAFRKIDKYSPAVYRVFVKYKKNSLFKKRHFSYIV